jgi:hypothetical protein
VFMFSLEDTVIMEKEKEKLRRNSFYVIRILYLDVNMFYPCIAVLSHVSG